MQHFVRSGPAVALAAALAAPPLPAADAPAADEAEREVDIVVVITPTRFERPVFDLPVAISAAEIETEAATPGVNPSEYLRAVPGVVVRDRQNYAQDQQLSIRGFGARSTFGVRGVRLYTDGIPATMPDGQGQTSHFPLSSAERIEVLRGPFSVLYGNASGGVVQVFTAEPGDPAARFRLGAGDYGLRRGEAHAAGRSGRFAYTLAADYFETDGYRRHSAAERSIGNFQLGFDLAGGGRLKFIGSSFDLPEAQDPQGLTESQFEADPRQAAPAAERFNTRKTVRQHQAGLKYEQPFGADHSLHLMAYGGDRDVLQFLSVPVAAQANPLSSGGVVDLDNAYGGADARWSWRSSARPLEITGGLSYDRLNQHRRGHENFSGAVLGVRGSRRRDERDEVHNFDQYVQGDWRLGEHWSLTAGLRHSEVEFDSRDDYIATGNPDDSGRQDYSATTPAFGLMYRATENWHFYGAYGGGFETPTFNELAYRPDGSAGLNLELDPARSQHFELGAKYRGASGSAFELALFDAHTRDELAVFSSVGGRTTFHNIGRARRRGLELGLYQPFTDRWSGRLAYTRLEAEFRSSFANCTTPSACTVPAGSAIPGVPKSNLYAELRWAQPAGWRAGIDLQALASVPANDRGNAEAESYATLGSDLAYSANLGRTRLTGFLRIENLLDKHYIGSVIVNEANGRFFEPAPGRTFFAGLNLTP